MSTRRRAHGRVTPKGMQPKESSPANPRPRDTSVPTRRVTNDNRQALARPFVGRPISSRAGHRGGR